ncbi:caspase family protein [Paraburkholderia dipogonis]|uniref:Caspase family protein n=1 Tax=Paraburkholderia dipogonis TaxID=1211383 RepID=A0ABW9ATV7_9BURK
MGQRRVLVIGTQCDYQDSGAPLPKLGKLSFLPATARDLYKVMTDHRIGGCVSALGLKTGLLINPTVNHTKRAIKEAYRSSAKDGATLFIAYIGHGEKAGDDFYLLPRDARLPPESEHSVQFISLIQETHRNEEEAPEGLGVLVDACFSGLGGFDAARRWTKGLDGTLCFEMITAAADAPASGGCFSKTLVSILRTGLPEVPAEYLRGSNVLKKIRRCCPDQIPFHPAFDNGDDILWLARNAARPTESWAQTSVADDIQRLTHSFQETPLLSAAVAKTKSCSCVAFIGDAGTGKSTLAAALAWPSVSSGVVPRDFVQGIVLINEATTPQELAKVLSQQLRRAVPGFEEAQNNFNKDSAFPELLRIGTIYRSIVGPLRNLAPVGNVRIVVDGLDRLAIGSRASIMDALDDLAKCAFVRLVITARPDTSLPGDSKIVRMAAPPELEVQSYLDKRKVPSVRRSEMMIAAQGNWLVLRVLADLLQQNPHAPIGGGNLALAEAYGEMLVRIETADDDMWTILTLLAVSGAGPTLPFSLLHKGCAFLGRSMTPAHLRDQLVRLRGLVARSDVGTPDEHAGLFHQTFVEHITSTGNIRAETAHRAILDSIEAFRTGV